MKVFKIWIDDIREKPKDYNIHYKTVWQFIRGFRLLNRWTLIIDLDHDAGDYERYGGDYYNILKWLEYQYGDSIKDNVIFKFHTANPVGRQNMINICERNCWKYEI